MIKEISGDILSVSSIFNAVYCQVLFIGRLLRNDLFQSYSDICKSEHFCGCLLVKFDCHIPESELHSRGVLTMDN